VRKRLNILKGNVVKNTLAILLLLLLVLGCGESEQIKTSEQSGKSAPTLEDAPRKKAPREGAEMWQDSVRHDSGLSRYLPYEPSHPVEPRKKSEQELSAIAREKLQHRIQREGKEQIVSLVLGDSILADADLEHLKGMTRLEYLVLPRQITNAGIERLKDLTSLRTLNLGYTQTTDDGLVHLKGLVNLKELYLSETQISDAGLGHLEGLELDRLEISNEVKTDLGLTHYLAALQPQSSLSLFRWKITDAGLEQLTDRKSLEVLDLGKTDTSDNGLVHLSGLTNLKELKLPNTRITDDGLEHLKALTSLEHLVLPHQITNAGLVHLKELTTLKHLYLSGKQINDYGLEHLRSLTDLSFLSLSGTKITDAGLLHLKGLVKLERLHLDDTAITDAGLEHLRGLTKLRILNVGNTPITFGARSKLEKALPNVNISQ